MPSATNLSESAIQVIKSALVVHETFNLAQFLGLDFASNTAEMDFQSLAPLDDVVPDWDGNQGCSRVRTFQEVW